jgi:hypothetical protein
LNKRLLLIPLAAASAAVVAIVATQTGADFNASSGTGTISGTNASVAVVGNDNGSMNISFNGPLVPGVVNTATAQFANTGNINEDVYVVFTDPAALHAFDQQGRYVQAYIQGDGTTTWSSANLNDGLQNGQTPAYTCSTLTNSGDPQICPLPGAQLVLSNVAPGGDHTFTFGFLINSSAQSVHNWGNEHVGLPFNPYPVDSAGNPTNANASGLPYKFYAVQAGGAAPVVPLQNAHN